MSHTVDARVWWELHLRKARGEALTESEQCLYDAELARQDREAPSLRGDLNTLKELRSEAARLASANDKLRSRLAALEGEITAVENSLSKETREVLGVEG